MGPEDYTGPGFLLKKQKKCGRRNRNCTLVWSDSEFEEEFGRSGTRLDPIGRIEAISGLVKLRGVGGFCCRGNLGFTSSASYFNCIQFSFTNGIHLSTYLHYLPLDV